MHGEAFEIVKMHLAAGVTQKYLIVTSNYPARQKGVAKLMSIREAQQKCPDLVLVNGEDLTPYRYVLISLFRDKHIDRASLLQLTICHDELGTVQPCTWSISSKTSKFGEIYAPRQIKSHH